MLTGRSSSFSDSVTFPRYFASAHSYITAAICPCEVASKLTLCGVCEMRRLQPRLLHIPLMWVALFAHMPLHIWRA